MGDYMYRSYMYMLGLNIEHGKNAFGTSHLKKKVHEVPWEYRCED